MNWTFTPTQAANWTQHWDRHPDRDQSGLAGKLSRIPVKGRGKDAAKQTKTADSWKPDLSNFFAGDAKALAKVFGDDAVCEVVARHLGLQRGADLRAVHARMRGEVADGPLDVRIPGFEDYGPVPAIEVYIPPLGGGSGGIQVEGEQLNLHPPQLDQLVRACAPAADAHAIAIEGGACSGKTTVLRALAASLERAGMPWSSTPAVDAVVLVVDDWHRLRGEQQVAVKQWLRPGRSVVIASEVEARVGELTTSCASIKLGAPPPYWLHGYVDKVRGVLLSRWNVAFDAASLHRWLDDEVLAPELVRNFRSLGIVLRAATEGKWPVRAGERPALLLRQIVKLVNPGPERTFLEDFGQDLLSVLAARIVASPAGVVSRRDIALFAGEIAAQARARVALDDAGTFRPVDALLAEGPFRVTEGRVTCDAPAFLLPAMRDGWESDVGALFTGPDAGHAAEAAAEEFGDEVLRATIGLPPGQFISALPTITRILRANAPYREPELWTAAFRMCATWWAHGPKTVGGAANPPPPATERFDGVSPLLILAQAGVRHQALLPTTLAALSAADDLPEPLRRWLAIHAVAAPDAGVLDAALWFVAPAQHDSFPTVPEVRSGQDWHESKVPGLLPQEWEVWWRTVLVPLWRKHSLGDGYIAGTAEGSSPIVGASQNTDEGLMIWTDALVARVAAGDPSAAATVVRAIVFAFKRGGSRVQQALVRSARSWTRMRISLRDDTLAVMLALRPSAWWESKDAFGDGESLIGVILREVLEAEQVDALWSAWATPEQDDLPWRTFVRAGVARVRVVAWALNRGADGLKPVSDDSPMLAAFGRSNKPRKSVRLGVIEEIAASEDSAAAIAIFAGPISSELRWRLRHRIIPLGPREFRRERIEAALAVGRFENGPLLENLLPMAEDAEIWKRLVLAGSSVAEQVGRLAQWCGGQEGEDRWRPLLLALDATEAEWASRPAAPEGRQHRDVERLQMEGGGWISRQVARKDLPGPEDRHEVVRRLVGRLPWAPAFSGWSLGGLWPLALEILPRDEFRELLVRDLGSPWGEDARPGTLGALMYAGQFDLVVGLLSDPDLGPAAASALMGVNFVGDPGWPLAKLTALASTRPFRVDGLLDRLAVLAVRHQPEVAVAWLAERLEGEAREVAVPWWEIVLRTMPPSTHRSRALDLYFTLVAEEPDGVDERP